jgi:aryl-alcohol dehydrogenase-like predicted oxidoreductase
MSDEDGTPPEPYDEMKQGFLLMQEQMASMMQMMQADRVSNTEKISALSAETSMLHAEVTANTIAETARLANRRPAWKILQWVKEKSLSIVVQVPFKRLWKRG